LRVGDIVQLVTDGGVTGGFNGNIGIIVDKTLENRPPGNHKILVYKVLSGGIIINVPLKWMVRINTHP
jgi:hypothetical protein